MVETAKYPSKWCFCATYEVWGGGTWGQWLYLLQNATLRTWAIGSRSNGHSWSRICSHILSCSKKIENITVRYISFLSILVKFYFIWKLSLILSLKFGSTMCVGSWSNDSRTSRQWSYWISFLGGICNSLPYIYYTSRRLRPSIPISFTSSKFIFPFRIVGHGGSPW